MPHGIRRRRGSAEPFRRSALSEAALSPPVEQRNLTPRVASAPGKLTMNLAWRGSRNRFGVCPPWTPILITSLPGRAIIAAARRRQGEAVHRLPVSLILVTASGPAKQPLRLQDLCRGGAAQPIGIRDAFSRACAAAQRASKPQSLWGVSQVDLGPSGHQTGACLGRFLCDVTRHLVDGVSASVRLA